MPTANYIVDKCEVFSTAIDSRAVSGTVMASLLQYSSTVSRARCNVSVEIPFEQAGERIVLEHEVMVRNVP